MKRIFSGLVVLCLLAALCVGCAKEPAPTTTTNIPTTVPPTTGTTAPPVVPVTLQGATVVLYTANVRGDISAYSSIWAAKLAYEARGATVYLVDGGNHLQGSAWANGDMGLTIYRLMEVAGYHVAALGTYDLAHGEAEIGYAAHGDLTKYYTQAQLYRGTEALTYQRNAHWHRVPQMATRPAVQAAAFPVLCSNLAAGENATGYYAFEPSLVLGEELKVGFVSYLPEDAADHVGDGFLHGYEYIPVTAPECDLLVSIGGGEGDIVIDVPADGSLAVGAYVFYPATGDIEFQPVDLEKRSPGMDNLLASLNKPYQVGLLQQDYSGSRLSACNGQSDLGQLMADAMKWYAETKLTGLQYPVIGLFNGGNCRNFLYRGEVTEQDVQDAIHGSMEGVGVVYMTGAQILELLEAATQRENCPGWAYVSGISYDVDLTKPYDFGGAYGSYYKANSVNRVSITSQGFDPEATYAVVADQLLLAGEDTYYMLKDLEVVAQGADAVTVLSLYIREVLNSVR